MKATMRIRFEPSAIRKTRWYEFAIRFLFGGLITAATGVIAKEFGPVVGGLFLAFPAIFPASATLVDKHEKQKKERAGFYGSVRGRKAAGVDAAGTALGTIGLIVFAVVVRKFLGGHSAVIVLLAATTCWAAVSFLLWYTRERM